MENYKEILAPFMGKCDIGYQSDILATPEGYDTLYSFSAGFGVDGGFGDYCSPSFVNQLYIHDTPVMVLGDRDFAYAVRDYANTTFLKEFHSDIYSGDFPMEVEVREIPVPEGSLNPSMFPSHEDIMEHMEEFINEHKGTVR